MSYEPPILSRKLGYGDAKAPESVTKSHSRLSQGEKPVNGLSRSLHQQSGQVQRQDFKLLIDPALKKGHVKIYRYNGVFEGQPPVVPKDPRSRRTRIWSLNKADLPVPNFKVDKWYVGIPPQREVHFSGLNDNVDKKFLEEMCERYGRIDAIKIYYDPQTKKHTGKGRVTYATTAAAKLAVSKLDHTSVMGNIIKAYIETNAKAHEVHGKNRGLESSATRRNSGHEMPPSVLPSSQLPTPSPSIMSQSSSTDSSVLSPSLLLMKSPASSVCLPADIWGTSLSGPWDKSAVSIVNKLSQSVPTCMSPQSVSSGQSTFEPVSPPHSFLKNNEPPPPPPPTSKPPLPPANKEPPPPPPKDIPAPPSSCFKYEDISPDPVFSPGEEDKSGLAKKGKEELNTRITKTIDSRSRSSVHSSSPPRKARSPRIDRSESYSKWAGKKQVEREEKYRDKYRESDRGCERDRSFKDNQRLERHGDFRHKRDGYFDRRDDYRQSDYDRNRSSRWEKDDTKYRRDRYSTSPRRSDEYRRSDVKDLRNRDPRLRDKDSESSRGRELHGDNERDKEERGEDGYTRDPRLKGRNIDLSETHKHGNKIKEKEVKRGSLETKDGVNKSQRDLENISDNSDSFVEKDFSKLQDPRLREKDDEPKGIYYSHQTSTLKSKSTIEQQEENHEAKDKDQECVLESVETESISKPVSAEEIISSVVAGTPVNETTGGSGYSEDAYILGVETCSDEEEPLPPGDERDVAHEVQLDIARNKIKAAQNAVKKRKLSETAFQDEKKNGGSKSKKIQIVLKSVQLNSVENEQTASSNVDDSTKDAESTGGWSSVSPDVAADVSVSSEAEDSSSRLNLPLTEDISPCNSPTIETTTHTECETSATSQDPAPIELYSDIEANEDENCVGDVNNDDNDDAMSLSSISSNEDTLEVTELDSKPSESSKGISVPPPNVVFPPYPPPIFNPNIPPPPFFNPRVPPPPITVPPPPLPTHPVVPPPTICPTLSARPIIPPSVPPPGGPPIPIPPPSIPPSFSGASGFYNPRAVPQFSSSGYANSGSYGYQKQEQKKHWSSVIIDEVYRNICGELETVVKRDIFKKLVQASAFKALESWWDNQSKPKTTPMSTTSSSRNVSMGTNPTSTVGLPSNSGTDPSAIGPSPFDRSHSMLLGLRASLPKLPSFKVKRPPQPPKTEQQSFSSRKRSNTESSDLERDSKKQMVEGADLGMETDLESSSASNKAPRAVSRMEGERSHSPWQQLDESMDAAPRATIVRSTEGEERRPSTGSSLYHKVYSSSSSESGSDGSDSEEEEEEEEEGESEEGSEEESESSESEEESSSESEEEDVPSESKEDAELAKTEMEIKEDIERSQKITPMVMESEQDSVQKSFTPVSVQDSPSSKWNESVVSSKKQLERTVETKTVSQTTNCKVEQVAHMEPFHSFHIANIVPDLFKNHDDSSDRAELTEDKSDSTQNEAKIVDKSDETRTGMDLQGLNQYGGHDEGNHSSSVMKVEEPLEKKDVKSPFRPPELGSQDKENIQPSSLKFIPEEKSVEQMDQDDDVLEDRRPLLSPNKPLAVSLVELDHSYGLTIPEPMLAQEEETKSFDEPLHPGNRDLTESPLPGQRELAESPVVDIVTVDSVQPRRPVPDLSLPKPQFPVRSFEADDELAYEFLRLGIDAEDCHYMKVGFEQLQQVGSQSVLDAHWSSHPVTAQPAPKSRRKQKTEQGVRVHLTGCARSEGFYKIDIKEKAKYLQAQRRQLQCQANITEKEQKTDGNKAKQQSREHRAIQRRLQSAVCNEEFGDLLKFNQLRVRKKQLRFAKSGIHDWGLFAQESIAADEMVTEYVGEIIRQPIADIRERRYEEMGIGSSYLFRVDQDTIIDATTKGNLARFINHCCDPNCYAKIVTLENEKKIVIYSKRDIQVNEEITYDYKFPIEDEKIPCLCGAPQCRGTLN